jgi:pyruvate formate lyase activating enzyme
MKEALYWRKLEDGRVQCQLCPHYCIIAEGEVGKCRVRKNVEGTLYSQIYAQATSVAMDPIEKKPLYHFYPSTSILSLGTNGCNFTCPWCQNWHISQRAVTLAERAASVGIAYTYNEPFIWFEYVLDTAKLACQSGLKNVLVTNGYVNQEPLKELLPYIHALNIDIKSMEEDFYRKHCGARLAPVLETARTANTSAHLELTNLVIPGENDAPQDIEKFACWVEENLGPETPVHFSAYFPNYRFTAPATPLSTLLSAYSIATKRLHYVYLGNVYAKEGRDTVCRHCGATIISRFGYSIDVSALSSGKCKACGGENNIVS